jgi:hypothetical protein
VLKCIVDIATPQAMVIVSMQKIAHFSVSLPPLLRGAFQYCDAGITGRTRLRLFVSSSAIALLNSVGLHL